MTQLMADQLLFVGQKKTFKDSVKEQKEQDIHKEKAYDGRWGRNGRLRAKLADVALLLLLSP